MNEAKKTARILVVDDDERNRRLLIAMLEAEGYTVQEAVDGERALELVRQSPPDIILLDIMLPGIDGYEVARLLKANAATQAIPIIMVTALDDRASRLRGLEAGAEEFVTKPVDRNELRVRVHNLLRLKEFSDFLAEHNRILEERVMEQTASLHESEQQFRGLVEQSITGIFIIQDDKFTYVNPRFAEIFGYESAEELIGRHRLIMVPEADRGAVTERIRRQFERDPSVNYEFSAVRRDGSPIEVGVHAARATHQGRPAIIGLMQDISEKSRAEEQIKRYVEHLEKALMSTVNVATTLSEMRDPYTAGHERRVAGIAVAIGAELGFDARRQEGLRVAGYLHDVGKITVPLEILGKPGKLTAIEYQLVQGHAQASYDVLKDVEFPWPVADVALQHHERIDGSGYPQGLKGDAILLEARIMAVADVVEAISSHRPYRPGLGIDKALAEIECGRGTAYDPAVTDACLKLFREKGYVISA